MPEIRDQLFIANGWTPARDGRTFETIDPSTEEVLATVARGGREDVDDAVAAARAAFEGPWRRVTPPERLEDDTWKILHRHTDTVTTPQPHESMIKE